MEQPHKKLYRSIKDRKIAGVCAGLAEYFNIDPTIIRVIWFFVVVFTGIFPGVFVYIIAALIIPTETNI